MAGASDQACRPTDHPLGRGCDRGLGCDDGVCVPAGGREQICRSCSGIDEQILCDRCDQYLGCHRESFTCEPAGAERQPCRELDITLAPGVRAPDCNNGLICVMGTCVPSQGVGQPCERDLTCDEGLFCDQTGSGPYGTCGIKPLGLVSATTTAKATSCIDGVPSAFAALARNSGHSTVFSFDAREGDRLPPYNTKVADFDGELDINQLDLSRDHVQGMVKLPGSPDRFLLTRSSKDESAGLMVADRSRALLFYPIESPHPGGLSMFGHTVAVAVEHGAKFYDECGRYLDTEVEVCLTRRRDDAGWIDFWNYDPSRPGNPLTLQHQWSTDYLDGNGSRASSVAFTRTPDGKPLVFMLGRQSQEGWLLGEGTFGGMTSLQHFPNLYAGHTGPYWLMYQNAHFITDCSGELYLLLSSGEVFGSGQNNTVTLFRLKAEKRGSFKLEHVQHWKPKYTRDRCQMRYSGNPVIENGRLSFICSGGLTTISDGDNIGVAEIR